MAFAEWRSDYATGVPEIDAQHRALLAAIEELHTAFMQNREAFSVARIVDFMDGYARSHFREEEHLFQKELESADEATRQRISAHLAKHRAFEEQVSDYLSRTGSNTRMLTMEVLHYLRDWLIHHIQETDQREL